MTLDDLIAPPIARFASELRDAIYTFIAQQLQAAVGSAVGGVRRAGRPPRTDTEAATRVLKTVQAAADAPVSEDGRKGRRKKMTPAQRKRTYGQPCEWRNCTKNLSPRTRPYCGEHAAKAAAKAVKVKTKAPTKKPQAKKKRAKVKKTAGAKAALANGAVPAPETTPDQETLA